MRPGIRGRSRSRSRRSSISWSSSERATAEELADLFEAFEVTTTYDKAANRLQISATVPAELVAQKEQSPSPRGASGIGSIAGARLVRGGDGRIAQKYALASQERVGLAAPSTDPR